MQADRSKGLPSLFLGFGMQAAGKNQQGTKLVKDPYSGKYYGDLTYEDYVKQATNTQNTIKQTLATSSPFQLQGARTELFGNGLTILQNTERNGLTLGDYLKSALSNIFIPEKGEYVYQEKMNQSYNMYGQDWDKLFKADYQNPRIAEEQKNRAVRGQREFASAMAQPTGAVSANSRVTKRQVGTGIGTSTFNPFGSMEAGLGL